MNPPPTDYHICEWIPHVRHETRHNNVSPLQAAESVTTAAQAITQALKDKAGLIKRARLTGQLLYDVFTLVAAQSFDPVGVLHINRIRKDGSSRSTVSPMQQEVA
jgi:hypothetical protein